MQPVLELTAPSPGLYTTILDGLRTFNRTLFGAEPPGEDLAIAVRDQNTDDAIGGLWGRTAGGWLAIELIFIPEALRGQGVATRLVGMAEQEAVRRGCHSAWLDTLNPRALTLYERLGYARFGELKDYPRGQSRHFLQKRLKPAVR
jgi:GNAT superfamily N-acetyltransferase